MIALDFIIPLLSLAGAGMPQAIMKILIPKNSGMLSFIVLAS
jgi:hypothetical protein